MERGTIMLTYEEKALYKALLKEDPVAAQEFVKNKIQEPEHKFNAKVILNKHLLYKKS